MTRSLPILVSFTIQQAKISRITLASAKNFAWEITSKTSQALDKQIDEWMTAYAAGNEPSLDLPLMLEEQSPFAKKVLSALAKIPFGATISYGALAEIIGHPGAARAVGTACKLNPFPLIIPCHRVIQSDGSAGGYAYGIEMKNRLLDFERT